MEIQVVEQLDQLNSGAIDKAYILNEFKVGDLVYWPSYSQAIYKLEGNNDWGSEFPLAIKQQGRTTMSFTISGRSGLLNKIPSIFHATLENKKILDRLYGVEFEEPSKTLYQKMKEHFNKGGNDVLCTPISCNTSKLSLVVIQGVNASFEHLIDNTGTPWTADKLRVLSSDEVNQFILQ